MFADGATPGRLRIKICGITNEPDARAAIESGADALGFNCFRGSRRYVNLPEAVHWIANLPSGARNVAVLVNPTLAEAREIASLPGIAALQLHGQETPELCASLTAHGIAFSKAVPVGDAASVIDVAARFGTRTVVLDSASAGVFGGSGKTFPWEIGRALVDAQPNLQVVLAGGLTPENVREAVRVVRPFGVDVTSGVEASAGYKDHARMRAFIEAACTA